jgi:hypothetical protein
MASGAQFQLFPPPPPKINTTLDSNPFRRTKSKPAGQGPSFPLQTLVKSPDAETVIIQIIEEPRKIQPLPQAHTPSLKEQNQGLAGEPQPGNNGPVHVGSSARCSPRPPPAAPASFCSASPTLVRSNCSPSQSPSSPILPMRSIFPTYNPSIPLSQQPYYPQREATLQGRIASRQDYSPNLASPSQLDEVLGGAKTAPSSVINFPMDDGAIQVPRFSSPQDLDRLWEATNGQDADAVSSGFDLQMSRYVSFSKMPQVKADFS